MEDDHHLTPNDELEQQISELLSQMTLEEKVFLLSGDDTWHTHPIPRLNIPSLTMSDGPHGLRARQPDVGRKASATTAFPTGIALASTWNPTLIEKVGEALAEETLAMGCDILLGPNVNIIRTPLAGRNFETYSEDPHLAGKIGAAWVRGVQRKMVGASLKHFACNNQETERDRGSSEVDERTLREIYLAAFETIVRQAQPWTVMCSYNRINGVYASQNHFLLTQILRNEWGFLGAVISDWGANHTTVESVRAGLDLEMPGPAKYYGRLLVEAVNNWQIPIEDVDRAASRILRLVLLSGRLSGYRPARPRPAGSVNTREHTVLARQVAEEAIVLLKNTSGILPLNPRRLRTLAVIGPNAADLSLGGGGSSFVDPPYRITPLEGLRKALGKRAQVDYAKGCYRGSIPTLLRAQFLKPPRGSGRGLWAEYFPNHDLSGEPSLAEVEPCLDFWWFSRGPAENIPDEFSARYTGVLIAPATGAFDLILTNTGIARLFLDGRMIIDSQQSAPSPGLLFYRTQARVDLEAGREYNLRAEFVKPDRSPIARLRLEYRQIPLESEQTLIAQAADLAGRADAAVVVVGMPEGYETEGSDRPDMNLPGRQDELVQSVAQANPNTIVVINGSAPVEMPWIEQTAAVLHAFYPGMEGGAALARILTGQVNPSGKLTLTLPRRYADNPTSINYPGGRRVFYGERIYVGYRYYDHKEIEPLFPFGHGLSYTTFEYSSLKLPSKIYPGETIPVSLILRNTGSLAGQEIVQLYVQDLHSSVDRPPKELKAFAKVLLEPGESQTVHFELTRRDLSYYDVDRQDWVAEPGEFRLLAGSSSRDIRLSAVFELVK